MIIFDQELYRLRRERNIKLKDDFLFTEVFEDLKDRLDSITKTFNSILELGSINSHLANYTKSRYENSKIIRTSDYIKNDTSIIMDNELLCFKDNEFDLIISQLNFHRVNDLLGSFIQTRNSLVNDGMLIASLFASNSLYELKQSLLEAEIYYNEPVSPHIFPFATSQDLSNLLQRAKFKQVIVDEFTIHVSYNSIIELMHDLRNMGETNIMIERSNKLLKKKILVKADEIYREKFALDDGSLKASFDIATITGIK